MTKLTDIMSKRNTKVQLKNQELILTPITLAVTAQLEDEGISLNDLTDLFQTKPTFWTTKFIWLLMVEKCKKLYENSLHNFQDSLTIGDLPELQKIIEVLFKDAMPVSDGVESKQEKKTVK